MLLYSYYSLAAEINGKAGNLNSALRHIYGGGKEVDPGEIVAFFDCDQVCSSSFFQKMVPHLLQSNRVALVSSQDSIVVKGRGGS